jgi:hypothetical protein
MVKKVKYVGNIPYFEGNYDVQVTIHNGEPIGNGEINNSGADMYRCVEENQGVPGCWLFRANEVEIIK